MREQGADSAAGQTAPPIHTVTPMQQAGKVERMLAQMVVRYGERFIRNIKDEDGNVYDLTIAQYIRCNLESDQLEFKHQVFNKILEEAVQMSDNPEFRAEPYFIHHDDIQISQEATQMAADHYHFSLSKEEEILNEEDRRENEENEMERLKQQVDHLLLDFRMDYVELHLKELMNQIKQASDDMEQLKKLMEEYREMQEIRNKLAKMLGSNIII